MGAHKDHIFGGDWTDRKLAALEKYLAAYLTALKKQRFKTAYIDAFAGTGYRTPSRVRDESSSTEPLFPELLTDESQRLLDGSARIALKARGSGDTGNPPRFNRYIFIERDPERYNELEKLRGDPEFAALASDIRVKQGEANREIQELCQKNWDVHRAVLFLDPYGMQVEWRTLESIARTEAIDLWLLFPLAIGTNRLVTRSGEIPPGWRARLDTLFGTTDWYDAFYKPDDQKALFPNEEERMIKATQESIGQYFVDRLRSIFPEQGVAQPGVLRNSSNSPLYLLCFAAGNKNGASTAVRIASHILKEVR